MGVELPSRRDGVAEIPDLRAMRTIRRQRVESGVAAWEQSDICACLLAGHVAAAARAEDLCRELNRKTPSAKRPVASGGARLERRRAVIVRGDDELRGNLRKNKHTSRKSVGNLRLSRFQPDSPAQSSDSESTLPELRSWRGEASSRRAKRFSHLGVPLQGRATPIAAREGHWGQERNVQRETITVQEHERMRPEACLFGSVKLMTGF